LHYLPHSPLAPPPQPYIRGKIDVNGVRRSIEFLNQYYYKIEIPNTGIAIIRILRTGQHIRRIIVGKQDDEIVVLPTDDFDTFLNKLTTSCHLIHTQNLKNIIQTPFTRSNATSDFVYNDDPNYVSDEAEHQLGFKLYKDMISKFTDIHPLVMRQISRHLRQPEFTERLISEFTNYNQP